MGGVFYVNNNQVSILELYSVSQAGEKLKEFYEALIADETVKKILCNQNSYASETDILYGTKVTL